jgi:hypothetical protein
VKTPAKILVTLAVIAILGVVAVMVTINHIHQKSRRQITQLVSEIQPGMSFSGVTSRLGQVSQVFTNPAEIQTWGTTKENRIVTNSTLHMFFHDAIPFRWICIYTDRNSQTVTYASWKDM